MKLLMRAVDGRVTPTAIYTVNISEAFPGAHVLLLALLKQRDDCLRVGVGARSGIWAP